MLLLPVFVLASQPSDLFVSVLHPDHAKRLSNCQVPNMRIETCVVEGGYVRKAIYVVYLPK